ncbi:MAG: class I SAM-dependent methyltransferase [Candidatus Yonathbacteria bacterium]|nr:class I SAM-dependent methyltransferase [Candidatus Yonathbacteria bacterium]NTW48008.1 class I SAM-dependent methyltransferase [Candidatus Yonathbacteria bacterium]
MQNLPTAETYTAEATYMPWGILLAEIEDIVISKTPEHGRVLDLLCGTGNLIGALKKKRPDMECTGVDLEPEYIAYAREHHPDIDFIVADAFTWEASEKFDVIVCTGGLHHLPHELQEPFLGKVASLLKEGGMAIVGDPYIPDYANEQERKLAAAELGHEYLAVTIQNGATDDVIQAAIDLIPNDVFLVEFKTSIEKVTPHFNKHFAHVDMHKTWGPDSFGDYYFVCGN